MVMVIEPMYMTNIYTDLISQFAEGATEQIDSTSFKRKFGKQQDGLSFFSLAARCILGIGLEWHWLLVDAEHLSQPLNQIFEKKKLFFSQMVTNDGYKYHANDS